MHACDTAVLSTHVNSRGGQVLIYHWNALAPRAVAELAAATHRLGAAGGLHLAVATEDGRHADAAAAAAAAAATTACRGKTVVVVRGHAATPDLQESLLAAGACPRLPQAPVRVGWGGELETWGRVPGLRVGFTLLC